MTTVEIKEKQEMPKIEESNEAPGKENIKNLVENKEDLKKEVEMIGDGLKKLVDDKINHVSRVGESDSIGVKFVKHFNFFFFSESKTSDWIVTWIVLECND